MKKWESFIELFSELNTKCNYIVMRNYENLLGDEKFEEHSDIDFLCDNIELFKDSISGEFTADNIHGRIVVATNEIPVDIRFVGDSYYDKKWEQDMLDTRRLFKDTIYVMNKINYYYSLLYHEIYHKNEFRKDYELKLLTIAKDENIAFNRDELKNILDEYMRERGYIETGYRSK